MDLPGASSGVNKTLGPGCEITCGTAKYVCDPSPGYSLWGGKFAEGGQAAKYPYSNQSDANSCANGAKGSAAQMFSAQQIPVKATIAREFGVFNKVTQTVRLSLRCWVFSSSQILIVVRIVQLFSAVPAASTPNHLFTQSATSCGAADNILYSQCGGPNATYPQMTICRSPISLFGCFSKGLKGSAQMTLWPW